MRAGFVVCLLLVLILPILLVVMATATAEPFTYRFTLASSSNMNAGVKLLWTCADCGKASQKVGDEGALKQESCIFKLTATRKACDDFVQDAHAKLSAAHANCPSLPHSDELLDGLRDSYSDLGSKPAPIPEPSSKSFTEGLLRHRIKALEKQVSELKKGKNLANSTIGTDRYWNREDAAKRAIEITITDANENDEKQKDWHRRHFTESMEHESKGLMGWIRYWAQGFRLRVVQLIFGLIARFNVNLDIATGLGTGNPSIDAIIVENVADSIELLKAPQMAREQTAQLDAILSAVASSKSKRHSRGIAKRLRVRRHSNRWKVAVSRRTEVNERGKPTLAIDKPCRWKGREGILRWTDTGDPSDRSVSKCDIEFSTIDPDTGEVVKTVSRFQGTEKKPLRSRLRPVPVTLIGVNEQKMNALRAKEAAVKKAVKDFFEAECPASPCARDRIRRNIGFKTSKFYPTRVQSGTLKRLHSKYQAATTDPQPSLLTHPGNKAGLPLC